jgi:OpgC protein
VICDWTPAVGVARAMAMQYTPVNTDVLPTFVLLHVAFPGLLWLLTRNAVAALTASLLLYVLVQAFGWNLPAWPGGEWYFNPLAWQVLFVFGAWYAYKGSGQLRAIVQSRVALLAILYLAFSLAIALSWQLKVLGGFMPDALGKLIYPVDKSNLDPLRLLHFLSLAIIVARVTPPDWHGLMKPWMTAMIRCGENSLAIYCFGVLLSHGSRHPRQVFGEPDDAGRRQHGRDRVDDRRRYGDDRGSQTGPARAKAVLRVPPKTDVRFCSAPARYCDPEQECDKQACERGFAGNGADGRKRLSGLPRSRNGLA